MRVSLRMIKATIKFLVVMGAIGVLVWVAHFTGIKEGKRRESAKYDDKIIFCKECCWKTTVLGSSLYTCAETKRKLWKRIP